MSGQTNNQPSEESAQWYDPPGWYTDPHGLPAVRWWDGYHWTAEVRPAPEGSMREFPRAVEGPPPRGPFNWPALGATLLAVGFFLLGFLPVFLPACSWEEGQTSVWGACIARDARDHPTADAVLNGVLYALLPLIVVLGFLGARGKYLWVPGRIVAGVMAVNFLFLAVGTLMLFPFLGVL